MSWQNDRSGAWHKSAINATKTTVKSFSKNSHKPVEEASTYSIQKSYIYLEHWKKYKKKINKYNNKLIRNSELIFNCNNHEFYAKSLELGGTWKFVDKLLSVVRRVDRVALSIVKLITPTSRRSVTLCPILLIILIISKVFFVYRTNW